MVRTALALEMLDRVKRAEGPETTRANELEERLERAQGIYDFEYANTIKWWIHRCIEDGCAEHELADNELQLLATLRAADDELARYELRSQ